MDELEIAKYHGAGNDFVMIEDLEGRVSLSPRLVAALCDRHRGVGADGLIRVTGADDADFFMDYYNAEGATAEMCGNGIRCLAKLVYERGLTDKTELAVVTRAGLKHVSLDLAGGRVRGVTVDMGTPSFARREIPMQPLDDETFLGESFEGAGLSVKASALSMGNPHLVLFVDEDPDRMDVHRIGPALETDERFPNRTNVEFVVPEEDGVRVRVWERGVGETMACGTGACATLVAAHLAGLVPRRARVHFPGGTLDVSWAPDDHVMLTGPAERVFEGTVDAGWLREAEKEVAG
ncbi:MAG: diaminopimelate epimerase [Actinobacteria bacterium]|nr:diaminopimelate epimerase [Actinomycetota bacterium]